MTEIRVRVAHVRQAGFCVAGLKTVCEQHGIDVRRLAREGIPISEVEDIDDANVQQVLAAARADRGAA